MTVSDPDDCAPVFTLAVRLHLDLGSDIGMLLLKRIPALDKLGTFSKLASMHLDSKPSASPPKPDEFEGFLKEISVILNRGQSQEALARLHLGLAFYPLHPTTWFYVAHVEQIGVCAPYKAQMLEENLRFQPTVGHDSLERRRELERAAQAYRMAVRLQPGFSEAYHQLGNCYLVLDRLGAALNSAQSAVNGDPNNTRCLADSVHAG